MPFVMFYTLSDSFIHVPDLRSATFSPPMPFTMSIEPLISRINNALPQIN